MLEYSIADAKTHLPRIIHEAEESGTIQLTRYGKPVAVILSESEYLVLKHGQRMTSKKALQAFLENEEFKDIDVDTCQFDQSRRDQQERDVLF